MSELPEHVISDLDDAMAPMQNLMSAWPNHPTLDWEALLDQLFERMLESRVYFTPLGHAVQWQDHAMEMVRKGYVFEHDQGSTALDDYRLIKALQQTGMRLQDHLLRLGTFEEGEFQYTYRGHLHHDAYYFQRRSAPLHLAGP